MLFFHHLNIFQSICDIVDDVKDLLLGEVDTDSFAISEEILKSWTYLSHYDVQILLTAAHHFVFILLPLHQRS